MAIAPYIIAISGKGGVGKTTFTALMVKSIIADYHKKVLVIDADPAANLALLLGIQAPISIGQIIDQTKKEVEKKSDFYDGSALLEYRLWEDALLEDPRFHFLMMGHTAGRGCYCQINEVLTYILENIKSYYDLILLDMDAGLEHLSRNTKRILDLMLILTDPSFMGFQTVQRIIELSQELQIPIRKFQLIGNMFSDFKSKDALKSLSEQLDIELLGIIPLDTILAQINLQGTSLLDIELNFPAYQEIKQIIWKILREI